MRPLGMAAGEEVAKERPRQSRTTRACFISLIARLETGTRQPRSGIHSLEVDPPDVAVVALGDDQVAEAVRDDGTDAGNFGRGRVGVEPLAIVHPEIVGVASVHPAVNDARRIDVPDAVAGAVLTGEPAAI